MFGIRNGMVRSAFCDCCARPWRDCLGRCSRVARPVDQNRRHVRLLNPSARPNWRYQGQPMAVYCNGCGGPYYSGCCNGFYSPVSAMGEILMIEALMCYNPGEALLGTMLMGCGVCYGSCTCGFMNPTAIAGDAMMVDGMLSGNVAEVAMGAALSCGCYGSCACGMGALFVGSPYGGNPIGTALMVDGIMDGNEGEAMLGAAMGGGSMLGALMATEAVDAIRDEERRDDAYDRGYNDGQQADNGSGQNGGDSYQTDAYGDDSQQQPDQSYDTPDTGGFDQGGYDSSGGDFGSSDSGGW